MSTTLDTISPVAVGTNPTIKNISYSATDWLEVKNDSPFAINVQVIGVSANSFFLTPFEHNGWPIAQLLQSSQLQIKNLSVIIIPSHYYSDVATENNSPTNICTINQLSQQEAQTNTYPLYTARMNTTVSTVADTLNNIGNAPSTPIIYAKPSGDANANGAVNVTNSGVATLGDSAYNGSLDILGVDVAQLQLARNAIVALTTAGLQIFNWNSSTGQLQLGDGFNINGELQLFSTADSIDIDLKPGSFVVNGATSGNATIWQPFIGNGLKIVLVYYNNFRNGNVGNQTQTFPTAFTTFQMILASNIPAMQLSNSGQVNVGQMIFSTTGGTAGTESSQANIVGNAISSHLGAANQLIYLGSQPSNQTGWLLIIGI